MSIDDEMIKLGIKHQEDSCPICNTDNPTVSEYAPSQGRKE